LAAINRKLLILLTAFGLFNISNIYAYEIFVGHGYTSCLTCHYNPMGNGPLNDYGRAVSAVAISGREYYKKSMTDEYLSQMSGFTFKKPSNNWFRPSANFRHLSYTTAWDTPQEQSNWVTMQASVNVVMKFLQDKLLVVGDIGYAPKPASSGDDVEEYRSREHYIAYRVNNNVGVYAGLMDKAYGLRLDNHTAYSRQMTGNTMNDQSHGLMVHGNYKGFEGAIHYLMGNMGEEADTRQAGFSTKIEYLLSHATTVGISYLSTASDFLTNSMQALHVKKGFGKGASLLLEAGTISKSAVKTDTTTTQSYVYSQHTLRLKRGIYFFNIIEYFNSNTENADYQIRFAPGIQYFPAQRVELRAELYNDRSVTTSSATTDSQTLLAQLHLWF
jgi:hypothetical protein